MTKFFSGLFGFSIKLALVCALLVVFANLIPFVVGIVLGLLALVVSYKIAYWGWSKIFKSCGIV